MGSALLTALLAISVTPLSATAQAPLYLDASQEIGLDFVHWNGMTGEFYYSEMMGGGAALFDYDGDGDLDVYLVQGGLQGPGETMADALTPYRSEDGGPPRDRLYRNDLVRTGDGRLRPRLVDVTDAAEIDATGYGMGLAVGDVDGDGDPDLYLVNTGSNQLLTNDGDGTFTDTTARSGTDDPRWSTAATFFDADGDLDLDLHVVSYVVYSAADNPRCFATSSRRDYCGPSSFEPEADRLFRNRGDGTFENVSASSGIGAKKGAGLGVLAADLDDDGRQDLYVTNDGMENFLWLNRSAAESDRTLRFVDEALLAGVAVNREGAPEASMGVDAADVDEDGDLDLFMTHLATESNTLYINAGGGLFEDRTNETGLGAPSLPYTSFGTVFTDVDNDGRLDLAVVSGAVRILEELARAGDRYPLEQPNQFFRQLASERGGLRFEYATTVAGEGFTRSEVSRALAEGDLDRDGDADLLLAASDGPARWLDNVVGHRGQSLGLELRGPGGSPLYGARAEVVTADGRTLHRRVRPDGSYAAASDPRILLGLGGDPGGAAKVAAIRLLPPAGAGPVRLVTAPPPAATLVFDLFPPASAPDTSLESTESSR